MSLREFALKYKRDGYPRNIHPWSGKVILTDVSASTLIYVDGRYTVEEYLLFSRCNVPMHSHPCDTITIFLGGEFFGVSIGGTGSGSRRYMTDDFGEVGGILHAGGQHAALIGEGGAVSLVVAEWAAPEQLNSAAIEWYGAPSGPIHEALLASAGKNGNTLDN